MTDPKTTRSVPDLAATEVLDSSEIMEGYRDGRNGESEPGDNRSLSFCHGWRNGACDASLREIDPEQRRIAREFTESSRRLA